MCDRRDMKMLVQDAKFKRLTDHPMNQRMGGKYYRNSALV